ncbi:spindle assembly abnormal protein 6 homolog [Daphnia pulex]|uniref:spindle assembly abnormal protein 6 homolog n=1 Tax=Daphnia pulex TaxID=6669 RepID=UPI001EDF736E|nr:spindle assembly abnormal protein 6 homolog [Daphnia pulex]XP_046445101.1 spindle assembly abnormal protein 6 homolog [Daphnia pulex]
MSKPFTWGMKSPITPTNFIGMRPSESDKVFENMVPVQMQLSATEERKHFLRLSVELISSGMSSTSFRKDLQIEITDEDDPYIFYSLRMSEEDFSVLKSQQGLLIDFSSFPAKFVQLVERCVTEHQTESPKFLILIRYQNEMSKPCFVFEIVETNPFKHLCHLSLRLSEGGETQIKKHLSLKLRQLKEEQESNLQTLKGLEQQIDIERKNNAQKTAELELLKCDFQSKLQDMQQLLKIEYQTEKQVLLQTKLDLEQQLKQHQMNAGEKEKNFLQQIKDLKEKNSQCDNHVKDTASRLVKAEEECNRLQQELTSARRRGASLDADFHSKERTVNQLRTKVAVLEQELKDKDILLAKQQDLLTSAQEQKVRLTSIVEEKDSVISRRESAVKTMTEELIKANDIIRKLQNDIRMSNQKLKTRTEVATEQEKILQQRENEIARFRAELNKQAKINDEVAELRSKNEEKESTIKNNEQIISYLNKQLNDLQLRSDNTTRNPQWFSTPNDGNGVSPKIPMSTIRASPLQLGQTLENRENDEPLDPKYFQPKSYGGLVRKEKSTERNPPNSKPSAYFKK